MMSAAAYLASHSWISTRMKNYTLQHVHKIHCTLFTLAKTPEHPKCPYEGTMVTARSVPILMMTRPQQNVQCLVNNIDGPGDDHPNEELLSETNTKFSISLHNVMETSAQTNNPGKQTDLYSGKKPPDYVGQQDKLACWVQGWFYGPNEL